VSSSSPAIRPVMTNQVMLQSSNRREGLQHAVILRQPTL
jgi:hypothetical protein